MDRRGFLKMLVGGVATAVAVRTFPFRVFSFPKDITFACADCDLFYLHPAQRVAYDELSLHGLRYYDHLYNPTGTYMGISRSAYPLLVPNVPNVQSRLLR